MSERFTVVKRGYDISEVDQYITQLETVIRSYKEKDSAINNALISAQMTATTIINDAHKNAGFMKTGAFAKLDAITASISVQKRLIKEFQDDYNRLANKYLKEFNETDLLSVYSKLQDLQEYIEGLATDSTPKPAGSPAEVESLPSSQSSWL